MSNDHKKSCPDCNTPDVEGLPLRAAETIHECPNCERTFTDFDRDYLVYDRDSDSPESTEANQSNKRRGWAG